MPGKYRSLYQYLDNRYANAVDLTFAQIEDHSASRCLTRLASITSGGRQRPERQTTASFAIVDIGQQGSDAESEAQSAVFERAQH